MRYPRLAVFSVCISCAATLAFAAGTPAEWPFTALPADTVVYVELPTPGQTSQELDQYAANVIGFPLTNLLQMGISGMLQVNNVTGLDMTRPISAMVRQPNEKSGQPNLVFFLPITTKDAFLANLKDPGTGQSRAKQEDGAYTVEDARSSTGKMAFGFTDKYVAVAESPTVAVDAASLFAPGKPIHQRSAGPSGDLMAYLPVERINARYAPQIESTISAIQSEFAQEMQSATMGSSTEEMMLTQKMLSAESNGALSLFRQVAGAVVAVDLAGSDIALTKVVTPKADTGFAKFISQNSALGDLPYKSAIPPDAVIAACEQFNMASLRPMIDWTKKELIDQMPGLTPEERTQCTEVMDQMLPLMDGKIMAAYTPVKDGTGPMMGMNLTEVIGSPQPPALMKVLDKYLTSVTQMLKGLTSASGMRISIEPLPPEGDMKSYKMVMAATGDPQVAAMIKSTYGESIPMHFLPVDQAVVFTTDPSLGKQVGARLGQTGAASIHPLESKLPANKLFAMRLSLAAVVREGMAMAKRAATAAGETTAAASIPTLPPAAPTPGLLFGAGTEGKDLVGQMFVPGAEVKGLMQVFMAIQMQQMMRQQSSPPPGTSPDQQ